KITHVFMADEPIVKPIIEITIWRDTEGNELKPYEEGKKEALEFNGYRFVETTPNDGITIHLYEKIQKPFIPGEKPTPPTPEIPKPQPNPVQPQPEPEKPTPVDPNRPIPGSPTIPNAVPGKVTEKQQVKRLANTGATETNTGLAGLGLAMLGSLLAVDKRRRKDEE
ncbi:LPXTG cell wall anchor domain-containing protein, partial [uncultured Gemella sp.]|uniref:LPXTG cell wall anchor domain-containing protein n=1 Tax=uncultured Gemella sp. TaxID=254352 RepID=UPI0028D19835